MIQADVKLDTLGYFCPMPIIMTLKKIKELTLGQVLEVVSDDEGIKKDMPAWCDTTGHLMVGLEEEQTKSGTIYKAFVKKTKKLHRQWLMGKRSRRDDNQTSGFVVSILDGAWTWIESSSACRTSVRGETRRRCVLW